LGCRKDEVGGTLTEKETKNKTEIGGMAWECTACRFSEVTVMGSAFSSKVLSFKVQMNKRARTFGLRTNQVTQSYFLGSTKLDIHNMNVFNFNS